MVTQITTRGVQIFIRKKSISDTRRCIYIGLEISANQEKIIAATGAKLEFEILDYRDCGTRFEGGNYIFPVHIQK